MLPVILGATLLILGSKVKVELGKFEFVAAGGICPFLDRFHYIQSVINQSNLSLSCEHFYSYDDPNTE